MSDEEFLAAVDDDPVTPADGHRAREARRLIGELLDAVPVGIAFFDRDLRFVRINQSLADINGLSAADHIGRRLDEVIAAPDEIAAYVRTVFSTGVAVEGRHVGAEVPRTPGAHRHFLTSYFPVARGGEVAWVGVTVVEITEREREAEERARLLEGEQRARRDAEAAAERLARLQVMTGRLAEASDQQSVAEIVVTHGAGDLGATSAAVCLESGGLLRVVAARGFDPQVLARFGTLDPDGPTPAALAFRTGEPVLIESLAERDERFPALRDVTSVNVSFASLPLVVERRSIGCINLAWATERTFTEPDRNFLLALARQAAQAMERARLYDAERAARAAAEEARERMAFLAEASRVLASSLDYEETLARLAHLAVPAVADAAAVNLLENGDLRLVVAATLDEATTALVTDLITRPSREPTLLGRVLVTGGSIVLPEVDDSLWRRMADDEEHLAKLRALGARSLMFVPLLVQDRVLGVLSLAMTREGRRFDTDDLPFVEDLAGRAAVAIENARAHQARLDIVRTLQASLLPPSLPDVPGVELAQRYHAMSDALDVGGDFFDVFPTGDGRWGVVIGDVCGKGVQAAALTALARYTIRAAAIEEPAPGRVLHVLNRAILESDTAERFCTIAHAILEPLDACVKATICCGGHPLPLLLRADGTVESVGRPGTAVGLFEELDLAEVETVLAPGDALVLYTDGVVEARSPEGEFAPDLLRSALRAAAGKSAEGIAAEIDRRVLAFEGGRLRDDTALLIVKVR